MKPVREMAGGRAVLLTDGRLLLIKADGALWYEAVGLDRASLDVSARNGVLPINSDRGPADRVTVPFLVVHKGGKPEASAA